jgi:hypothetical protein
MKKTIGLIIFSVIFLFFSINQTNADCTCATSAGGKTTVPCDSCTPNPCPSGNTCSVNSPSPKSDSTVSLKNPLTNDEKPIDINTIIGKAISGLLGIVGSIALVMFIYGGFTWMLAAGSPNNVKKGRDILVWATIGLAVIFSAYGLVNFIFQYVLKAI